MFTACQIVSSYFIYLWTVFATWKIQPATHSNVKQIIQSQLTGNNAEVSRINCGILWCLTFPRSWQQTSCYKLLLGQFWRPGTLPSLFKLALQRPTNLHSHLEQLFIRIVKQTTRSDCERTCGPAREHRVLPSCQVPPIDCACFLWRLVADATRRYTCPARHISGDTRLHQWHTYLVSSGQTQIYWWCYV